MSLTFAQKYAMIGQQDTQNEGQFITAVKTTGIFCRPSCRARKPKPENVEFFDSVQQALQHGYRPCKVCKPMNPLDDTPPQIAALVKELQQDPQLRINDQGLRERDLEPATIRRWFQKHHNMTFHAFQRMQRINCAFNQIRSGTSVTHSAYDAGYNSLSGFKDSFDKVFGRSPKQAKASCVLNICRFTTTLGPMYAVANDDGLCLLEFTDRRALETEFDDLQKRLNAVILPGEHPILEQVQQQITEYFDGKRQQFDLPLHTPGTPFQQSVWRILQQIPYGKTRSYKQQAIALHNPKAVRAVATANGHNRIAIVIPCHRVVGSDGSLTGYAGGLHRKRWLLDFEQKQID